MKNYIIIGLSILVVILCLYNSCRKVNIETNNTNIFEHYSDTTHYSDTLGIWSDTIQYKKLIPSYISIDTNKMDLSDTNVFFSTFHYDIKDSLLDAKITVKETDYYPEVDFKYTLKNFTINNTTTIKDSTYVEKIINKNKLYIGGDVTIQPLMSNVFVGVSFAEKHGHLFDLSIGNNFVDNKIQYRVGYKRLISFKKK